MADHVDTSWAELEFNPEYGTRGRSAVARLHAAVLGHAPRLLFAHLLPAPPTS